MTVCAPAVREGGAQSVKSGGWQRARGAREWEWEPQALRSGGRYYAVQRRFYMHHAYPGLAYYAGRP